MKNKAFTLVELLAVIMILGFLMLIAIPSVSNYISGTKKQVFVDTSKELIKGVNSLIADEKIVIPDDDTTYYIPYTCVPGSDDVSSPYGEFVDAYVIVNKNKKEGYDYYFYGYDKTGNGIVPITSEKDLDQSCIKGGIDKLNNKTAIDGRSKAVVFSKDCSKVNKVYKMLDEEIAADKEGKHAIFLSGRSINTKMKTLSNDLGTSWVGNKNIRYIKYAATEPSDENKTTNNLISLSSSEYPIYMWFDYDTIYIWSEDKMPSLNSDASYMFSGLNNLVSIEGIEYFDVSNVIDFTYFFGECKSLQSLDLNYWDTSKVTDFSIMFDGCESLRYLDVSNFDTSNATDLGSMFRDCHLITSLDLSGWDTSKVTEFGGLFWFCYNLTDLDISNFNTSNAIDMSYMFSSCKSLESLDLSHFNTSKVTGMYWMFGGCYNLKELNITSFDTRKVSVFTYFLLDCSSLLYIDLSNFSVIGTNCLEEFFSGCSSMETIDISSFDTRNINNFRNLFRDCTSLKTLIYDKDKFITSNATTFAYMFCGCSSLENIDLSFIDSNNVTSMSGMFFSCSSLKVLDLSTFTFQLGVSVRYMFYNCSSLTTIYVSEAFSPEGYLYGDYLLTGTNSLVGQNGTASASLYNPNNYAQIDYAPDSPGLFSVKV